MPKHMCNETQKLLMVHAAVEVNHLRIIAVSLKLPQTPTETLRNLNIISHFGKR